MTSTRRRIIVSIASIVAIAAIAGFVNAADTPETTSQLEGAPQASSAIAMAVDLAATKANPPDAATVKAGKEGWKGVYAVLMSPRCMNCHPAGDRPLQTDANLPHAMNISRASQANGLDCSTCHQTQNSEALGVAGGPPGAPNWHLPHEDMPLIFEGRTPRELCEQMKRPKDNGYKTLDALLHHVSEDPLVLWGWKPGGDRTKPPLSHDEFVEAFDAWVKSGGACP
jgi:hypothetical protein